MHTVPFWFFFHLRNTIINKSFSRPSHSLKVPKGEIFVTELFTLSDSHLGR
jgi:hypothetical protein